MKKPATALAALTLVAALALTVSGCGNTDNTSDDQAGGPETSAIQKGDLKNPAVLLDKLINWANAGLDGLQDYQNEHDISDRISGKVDDLSESYTPAKEPGAVDFNKVGDKGKEVAASVKNKGKQAVSAGKNIVDSNNNWAAQIPIGYVKGTSVPVTVSTALVTVSGNQKQNGSMKGYDRKAFPHWKTNPSKWGWGNGYPASCTTRQAALIRDGQHLKVNKKNCKISGTWTDAYGVVRNGRVVYETISVPKETDVDHVVALALAWRSGANKWTVEKRTMLANDPLNLVVTGRTSNRSKGDQSVETYMPPLGKGAKLSARCDYVMRYLLVKRKYGLSVTPKEYQVLKREVHRCWPK